MWCSVKGAFASIPPGAGPTARDDPYRTVVTTGAPRLPRVRRRPLPDAAKLVLVRGDDLDPHSGRRQAEAFFRRWPDWQRYGLSAYFAEDDDAVADLAADQFERFPVLRVYDRAVLTAAGFEVVPTFRSPHVTVAFVDLDAGLAAIEAVEHETRPNPYHEG